MNKEQLIAKTREVANETGVPIKGYLTDRTAFFMEVNSKPSFGVDEKLLDEYVAKPDEVEEKVNELNKEAPSMKWTRKELISYMDGNDIIHFPRDTKKELLYKIENA